MMAFVIYDTLLSADLYTQSWKQEAITNKETGTKFNKWIPVETFKTDAQIIQLIKTELLKYFPKFLEDVQANQALTHALKYTVRQLKFEMGKNVRITMRELLDGFYRYLLWTSIEDIMDGKTSVSFTSYMEHYPEGN